MRIIQFLGIIGAAGVFLIACHVNLTGFTVPERVAAGTQFEIVVGGYTTLSGHAGDRAGAVLQIPDGFVVVDVTWEAIDNGLLTPNPDVTINDPEFLGLYAAEPGHSLVSFSAPDYGSSIGPSFLGGWVRVKLEAPGTTGTHTFKCALAADLDGSLQPQQPPGITAFAFITTPPHARSLTVVATEAELAGRWVLDARGLPHYDLREWRFLDLGDVDGDGGDDLLAAGVEGQGVHVFLRGPNDRWFDASEGLPSGTPHPVSAPRFGDFDGDGHLDVALSDGTLRIFYGDGGQTWTEFSPVLPTTAVGQIAVGDFDGDGLDDLVVGDTPPSGTALRGFSSNGNTTFTELSVGLPAMTQLSQLEMHDLDGDGRDDVMTRRAPNMASGIGIWRAGPGGAWAEVTASGIEAVKMNDFSVGDVDGDGLVDIVASILDLDPVAPDPQNKQVRLYRQIATDPPQWMPISNSGLPLSNLFDAHFEVLLVDLNGDGLDDVLAVHTYSDQTSTDFLEASLSVGDGTFVTAPAWTTRGLTLDFIHDMVDMISGDVDGDGQDDLVFSNANRWVFQTLATGVGIWRNRVGPSLGPCGAGTVDDGAGGLTDVVTVNGSSGDEARRVAAPAGEPLTLTVWPPPGHENPAHFALFGIGRVPGPLDGVATPWGGFCFVPNLAPSPELFTVASSFAPADGIVPATPAPWSFTATAGLPFPVTFTIQGAIVVDDAGSADVAVTNGVIIEIR